MTSLSSGSSLPATTTVTVPSTTPNGTYFVLACADDALKVREANESNNCLTASTTLLVAKPDLVTTAVSNPPAATAPASGFSTVAAVRNPSPVTAAASTLRFYLSLDAAKGSGDVLCLAPGRSRPSPPGRRQTARRRLPSPRPPFPAPPLLACADDQLKVAESDENNCLSSASTVLIARPDLAEIAVGNPPATANPGSSVVVTDTVHNPSPVSLGGSSTRYYLSLDGVKGPADVLLTGTRSVPNLAAGATSTAGRSVRVPLTTPLGTYRLLACADDVAAILEADEANNCRDAAASVTISWPDLVTATLSNAPPNVVPGGTFAVTDTVLNQGGHLATSSTSRYYLSADGVKDAADTLLSTTRAIGALGIGQVSTGSKTLTVPTTMAFGRYVVLACADDLNQLGELDNANNCLPSGDFVVGPPNARPVADAGSDLDLAVGVGVQLDGSDSTDADGDALLSCWTLLAAPTGSTAGLPEPTSVTPAFNADLPGQYVVQLIVYDGREFSVADVLTVTTGGATRFVGIGDTGLGDAGQYAGAALLRNTCERSGCDFVVLLGDNIYQSGVESVTDDQFNTKFELPYADVDVPFYAVLGNHDYGNGGTGDSSIRGSSRSTTRHCRASGGCPRTSTGSRPVPLNSSRSIRTCRITVRTPSSEWTSPRGLPTSSARWKIALGHHPYRSNGSHGNAGSYNGTSGVPVTSGDGVKSFIDEVVCGRVDLLRPVTITICNGCSQTARVSVRADCRGAGSKPKGLRSPTSPGYNQPYFRSSQLGFLYVVVTTDQLTAEFVGANGQTLFVRSVTKAP